MKYLSLILSIFFLGIQLNAQKKAHIHGWVENAKEDGIIKDINFKDIATIPFTQTNFDQNITLPYKGFYYLFYQNKPMVVYFDRDEDIEINADGSNSAIFMETLSFRGENAANNNYLMLKNALFRDISKDQKYFKLEEKAFFSKEDSIFNGLNERIQQMSLTKEFVEMEKISLEYDKLARIISYPLAHRFFTNNTMELSDEKKNLISEFDFNNEKAFSNNPSYKNLLNTYWTGKFIPPIDTVQFEKEFSAINHNTLKDHVLRLSLSNLLKQPDYAEFAINLALEHSEDAEILGFANAFKQQLNKKPIRLGDPSPGFNFEDINGKMVSLDDFKGKYVYIDVWAVWCGPCKMEIPYLKKLEERFKDENIAFVSISVDKVTDIERWKSFVQKKELHGTQLFADNSFQSDFITSYDITSIPRFLFLDPEGKIISENAMRPSDPNIMEYLKQNLSK